MPTNLYGPGDNFDLQSSHVLPALMRKTHEARARARRKSSCGEPAHRAANSCMSTTWPDAAVFLMLHYDSGEIINVGTGIDMTIRELAEMIQRAAGYREQLRSTRRSRTACRASCWTSAG